MDYQNASFEVTLDKKDYLKWMLDDVSKLKGLLKFYTIRLDITKHGGFKLLQNKIVTVDWFTLRIKQ